MKVERIDHIHIFVKDLDKAVTFFEDILNSSFSETRHNEELELNWRMNTLGLELLSSSSPNGIVAKFIERKGEGLAGISLKVHNIEEAVSELQSHGIRLISRYEGGILKEAQFHPKDCFGVVMELCEYTINHGSFIANEANKKK